MLVYLNGEYVDSSRALVSVDDRGFLFGDGVYEVTRALRGRQFEPERHTQRLRRGLDGLDLRWPFADEREPEEIGRRLLEENALVGRDAVIYLQVTRGAAPRTHHFPPESTRPTVYLAARAFSAPEELRARGADAITHPDLRWARCDLKTVNLLPNVLAKQAATAAGAFEAVFTRDGLVTEGANTNVWVVADGVARTHPATHAILGGVTRDVVLELAASAGIPVIEEPVRVDALWSADEVFVTSTTSDVMPVVRIDGRTIGAGAPGPVARTLYDALVARMG
jgi:D-alanine transaminase